MELSIIRHAQSFNNALQDQSLRVVDPDLTDLGQHQVERLAAYLAAGGNRVSQPCETEPPNGGDGTCFGITRLITSPVRRTLLTTRPIARALGLRPEVWPDIHEHGGMWLDHGGDQGIIGYLGLTRAEVLACLPDAILPAEVTDAGWYNPMLGQETLERAAWRAEQVAIKLRRQAVTAPATERIALVTHGGFSSLLLSALLAIPFDGPVFFHHDNTGITWVRLRADGAIRLRYINRVTHLPADLIT